MKQINLLPPEINEGITVKQSLARRHSTREFSSKPLSLKNLSEVLWACYGVNRPDTGQRTSPSACAVYPLRLFALMEDGIYAYDPLKHCLNQVVEGDFRDQIASQDFAKTAPLNILVYSDYSAFESAPDFLREAIKGKELWMSCLDTGASLENAYLYCTCAGLNVIERMMVDYKIFAQKCNLPPSYRYIASLTVGYPPEA